MCPESPLHAVGRHQLLRTGSRGWRGDVPGAERRACRLKPAFQAGAPPPLLTSTPRWEPPFPGRVATCAVPEHRACRLKPAFQAGAPSPLLMSTPRREPPFPGRVATCAVRSTARAGLETGVPGRRATSPTSHTPLRRPTPVASPALCAWQLSWSPEGVKPSPPSLRTAPDTCRSTARDRWPNGWPLPCPGWTPTGRPHPVSPMSGSGPWSRGPGRSGAWGSTTRTTGSKRDGRRPTIPPSSPGFRPASSATGRRWCARRSRTCSTTRPNSRW